MLPSQDLRGGHQRALEAAPHTEPQRRGGHDRFPGTDVALQ